jgi:predicted enzyme related to lactoylglutathione lyase
VIASEFVHCFKSIFMGKITGLGGVFIKSSDPKALSEWYEQNLGIGFNGSPYTVFPFTDAQNQIQPGYNILSFFKADSPYFEPSEKATMLNLRVNDLHAVLDSLRSKGVTLVGDPIDTEYGKFGWMLDPEGNKIELWEPPVEG